MNINTSHPGKPRPFARAVLPLDAVAGLALIVVLANSLSGGEAPRFTPVFLEDEIVFASAVATDPPYLADPSGKEDSTRAIQTAIDAVHQMGGGVVFLPEGFYEVRGRLEVKPSVTLMGQWRVPTPGGPIKGTVLKAFAGRGEPDGEPFIKVPPAGHGNVLNLAIWYPEQTPDHIVPYPWTLEGRISHFRNITLCNSYRGIHMASHSGSVVAGIYGTVLEQGVWLTNSAELCQLYDVHFNERFWLDAPEPIRGPRRSSAEDDAVKRFIAERLVGVRIGRVDGLAMYDVDPGGRTPVLIEMDPRESLEPSRNRQVYGFGGIIARSPGRRVEVGWDPWYFGMHYADLDLVPEAAGKEYVFAGKRKPRKTDLGSIFDVRDPRFGAAADGERDDTEAIAKALEAAGAHGGGTVYLPQGQYRVTAPLVVPAGVELRGPVGVGQVRAWFETCVLLVCHGRGSAAPDTDPAAITLMENAGLRALNISHPEQIWELDPNDPARLVIRPYPYTIRGRGPGIWIEDVLLTNSYNGIDLAAHRCDEHLLRGIWATFLNDGIKVGGGSRRGKLERISVDFGPWHTWRRVPKEAKRGIDSPMNQYVHDHNTVFLFGDCSGESAFALASFYPKTHVRFCQEDGKETVDADFWLSVSDVAKEASLDFEAGQGIRFWGLFATGGGSGIHNWIEASPSFRGQVNVYAKMILPGFVNRPIEIAPDALRLYNEVSLTTGKPVTAGSSLPGCGPERAVDRDERTAWEAPAGSTLELDLGRPAIIRRWAMRNAGLFGRKEDNTWQAQLSASLDGVEFQEIARIDRNRLSWIDLPVEPEPVTARFVRLEVPQGTDPEQGDHRVRIHSFDLFGELAPEPSTK